jgi:hypothetical protein
MTGAGFTLNRISFLCFWGVAVLVGCTTISTPSPDKIVMFRGKPASVNWVRHEMDYNTLRYAMRGRHPEAPSQNPWLNLPIPRETKETFAGYCGTYTYCVPFDVVDESGGKPSISTGSAMLAAFGILTYPSPPDLPYYSGLRVYNWEFQGARTEDKANTKIFSENHYYVFCLNRKNPQRPSEGKLYELPALAPQLIAIIEITPTFASPVANAVLPVSEENLLEYKTIRDGQTEFRITTGKESFEWEFDGKNGRLKNNSVTLKKLVYALNMAQWEPVAASDVTDKSSPVDSFIRIRSGGTEKEIVVKYNRGLWYFRSPTGEIWGTLFPELLHDVQGDCKMSLLN